MTPLDEALVLRGVDFYRLVDHLKPPDGNVVNLSGSIDLHRLLAIKRGDEPTEAEARAIGAALDFPGEFFTRWRDRPATLEALDVFFCRIDGGEGPRDRALKCACGKPAGYLCDEPTHGIGTCSRPVCRSCKVDAGLGEHRCPEHA